ncbi:MAG: retropepsin-like aspartic protease [Ekhidna sp.]
MRKIAVTVVLCQIALMSTCQPTRVQRQSIVLPMDVTTRRPIVEVMIDGKGPFKFIFDTGSSANVIDESLNEAFGFEVVGEDPLRTPGSENKLVSQRVNVEKVSFPGTNISKDAEMNVIAIKAMVSVDGILGGYFLEDYLVTMDYPGSKLILTIGGLSKDDDDVTSFIQNPRVLNLNIDVDGHSIEAHLDTGNPSAFTLPYSMKDKLTFKEPPVKGSPIRTPVASFNRWDAELVGSIKIGNATYENPKVMLAEGFEFVNLGYEVLKDLRTTIDRKNNLIKFEKVGIANSGSEMTNEQNASQASPFAGVYEGERKIWVDESGELQYQRAISPVALKLVLLQGDLYEMKVPEGVRAPGGIPNILFIRNEQKVVTAIELVYADGRKDGPFKKEK